MIATNWASGAFAFVVFSSQRSLKVAEAIADELTPLYGSIALNTLTEERVAKVGAISPFLSIQ